MLKLYRLTRSTGTSIGELGKLPADEVAVMLAIEEARYLYFVEKLNQTASNRQAEIVTANVLQLLAEYQFGL